MTTRRKSIARRYPYILYRVEPMNGNEVKIKAWEADDNARMIKDRYLGSWKVANQPQTENRLRGEWIASNETDAIHSLPPEVRDALWEIDDKIRLKLKKGSASNTPSTTTATTAKTKPAKKKPQKQSLSKLFKLFR